MKDYEPLKPYIMRKLLFLVLLISTIVSCKPDYNSISEKATISSVLGKDSVDWFMFDILLKEFEKKYQLDYLDFVQEIYKKAVEDVNILTNTGFDELSFATGRSGNAISKIRKSDRYLADTKKLNSFFSSYQKYEKSLIGYNTTYVTDAMATTRQVINVLTKNDESVGLGLLFEIMMGDNTNLTKPLKKIRDGYEQLLLSPIKTYQDITNGILKNICNELYQMDTKLTKEEFEQHFVFNMQTIFSKICTERQTQLINRISIIKESIENIDFWYSEYRYRSVSMDGSDK